METINTMWEAHMHFVRKLIDRGEDVAQPEYGHQIHVVNGYIKTQNPHKDVGMIFQDNDDMFGLIGDMGKLYVTGIDWNDLGLCDSRCWYEWTNSDDCMFVEEHHPLELALQRVALAWCAPSTENIAMIPELAEEFAKILGEVWSHPWLGNATTRELLEEIKTRIEMDGNLDYRTVDE